MWFSPISSIFTLLGILLVYLLCHAPKGNTNMVAAQYLLRKVSVFGVLTFNCALCIIDTNSMKQQIR